MSDLMRVVATNSELEKQRVNEDIWNGYVGRVTEISGDKCRLDGKMAGLVNIDGLQLIDLVIQVGDFIDTDILPTEVCELFCEIAKKQGYTDGTHHSRYWFITKYRGINGISNCRHEGLKRDITKQLQRLFDGRTALFDKSDLKDGMVIELRNNDKYYVCGNKGRSNLGDFALERFNADLTHDIDKNYDIVKIVDRDSTTVFVRQEPQHVELTLQQIAEKFGLDVGKVRIKED